MQVDISKQILKWKALDRWENEGGSISDEWKEMMDIRSSGAAESNTSNIRDGANVAELHHPSINPGTLRRTM